MLYLYEFYVLLYLFLIEFDVNLNLDIKQLSQSFFTVSITVHHSKIIFFISNISSFLLIGTSI